MNVAAIALWNGDEDGYAVRGYWQPSLAPIAYLSNLTHTNPDDVWIDIATCSEANAEDVGDHCLVLSAGGMLRLWNQFGGLIAEKRLTETAQGYYPFGANAHTLCVGELVSNAGLYSEEIVVATNTGLMWLHVDDLLHPDATRLPAVGNAQGRWVSGFWLETEKALMSGVDTQVQARTNATLASAWALARRPGSGQSGYDDDLHVLDQRGAYWRVAYDGSTRLYERTEWTGARGWDYVGPVSNGFLAGSQRLGVSSGGSDALIGTDPWFPRDTLNVVFEKAPSGSGQPNPIPNNWVRRLVLKRVFEGFLVHLDSGGVTPTPGGREAWHWSSLNAGSEPVTGLPLGPWGNLLEGLRIPSSGAIDGIWASSNEGTPVPGTPYHDRCPYYSLRSYVTGVPIMAQQSVRPVRLETGSYQGQTAVVLGCPGGRVRVLLPGAMRMNDNTPHVFGPIDESADLGYGGSALAVRHVATPIEELVIWFGRVTNPAARPANYDSPTGWLGDAELATGAVHRLRWVPGSGFTGTVLSRVFEPTLGAPRGAFGVVGLLETDLEAWSGREIVVATMSGDLLVLDADTLNERWRTHVDGSIGFFNSLVAADLNGDGHDEIYVSGSKGLWRFTQQGEGTTP